jgi:hypothetical protein
VVRRADKARLCRLEAPAEVVDALQALWTDEAAEAA